MMKNVIFLFFIFCWLILFSTCKKEVSLKYPTSIIGKWRYIGLGNYRDGRDMIKFPDTILSVLEITKDSIMLLYEGNLNTPISNCKVKLINNYNKHIINYEQYYLRADGSYGTLEINEAYEIEKDLLIFDLGPQYYIRQYGFYMVYP